MAEVLVVLMLIGLLRATHAALGWLWMSLVRLIPSPELPLWLVLSLALSFPFLIALIGL